MDKDLDIKVDTINIEDDSIQSGGGNESKTPEHKTLPKVKKQLTITRKKSVVEKPVVEKTVVEKPVVEDTIQSQNDIIDLNKISKQKKSINASSSKKQDDTLIDIFNEDMVDYRYIMMNYDFSKNKTLAKITKYEKALLIGKRAKQIEEGANPNIKVYPGQNSIEIAEEELRQRKIPFIIKRPIGNTFEYWRPIDMEVIMD